MAKIQVVVCDRCDKRSNGTEVSQWIAQRGKRRYTGDLCEACWNELINSFKPVMNAARRHEIVATPIDEIGK